jgi:hypothetical protein
MARGLQGRRDFRGAAELIKSFLGAPATAAKLAATELLIDLALCRLRMGKFDDCKRILDAAEKTNPRHPLIGRFRLYPALMALQPALDRLPLAPIPAEAPAGRRALTAMYFFLDMPSTTSDAHAAYAELMRRSIASLKATVPGAKAMLITDLATEVSKDLGFDHVDRRDLDSRQLVHARVTALAQILGRELLDGDVVLLDPDTLVVRDFRGVYEGDFDLGFTQRSDFAEAAMDHEPLNVGVIFVRRGRGAAARRFFEICLQHFADIEARPAVRDFYPQGLRA